MLLGLTHLEVVRQEWEAGSRRLESERDDPRRYRQLVGLLELLLDELRKRVGQTYTLAELSSAYAGSERWAHEALGERATAPSWARDFSTVLAAAFDAYQRGASDYQL